MIKPLSAHNLNTEHIERLSGLLDQFWTVEDYEPTFPTTDHRLAGTAMLLAARMLVAGRTWSDYFQLERPSLIDFSVKFQQVSEIELDTKTIRRHTEWLLADGTYPQEAVFPDTEIWAELNYRLLTFCVSVGLRLGMEMDRMVKSEHRLSEYLIPTTLLAVVARPDFGIIPKHRPGVYWLYKRTYRKVHAALDTTLCPLPF